jgi:lipopolysaccharide/colanic/teichoic acid biosynthesis glycosyltransferase
MHRKIPDQKEIKNISFQELQDEKFRKSLAARNRIYLIVKRIVDVLISIASLIIFFPVWLIIIVLIRLDSRGSAIFSHERVGKNGKIFRLYKFRTMRLGVNAAEYAPTTLNDPRITRIGKFLRRTSLDEVPQFLNIIKGDMALIGPRPEMQFIVKKYDEMQKCRLLVLPGLTGLWQILGRKDLPLHENAEYDYYYILHQSLALDLIISLKTVSVIISGKGAY